MPARIDLTGRRFGKLVVIECAGKSKSGILLWHCKCDCGEETTPYGCNLMSGKTTSCGCSFHMPQRDNLAGMRFGMLTAIECVSPIPCKQIRWLCRCDCGKELTIYRSNLSRQSSCGCAVRRHGGGSPSIHGMSQTREYSIWQGILARCDNPTCNGYANYGGRGIRVCDEWRRDFLAFYDYVGPRPTPKHSLERIDNERGYEPGNVKWATCSEQLRNRRKVRAVGNFSTDELLDELGRRELPDIPESINTLEYINPRQYMASLLAGV
jgi:hypothetical protein